MFLRTVAVVGLIAVLLLGAWGIILLAFNLPAVVGSLGTSVGGLFSNSATSTSQTSTNANGENIAVTAPASAVAGQPLAVSWNHTGASGQYAYTISYSCQNGVSMKAPLPTGSYQTTSCNTPFNYVNASQHMTLIPSGSGTITFTVSAKRLSDNTTTTSGAATTIISGSTASNTSTPSSAGTGSTGTPSYTYVPATQTQALYGSPDLSVRIISTAPTYNGRTNVVFEIQNVGTNVAHSGWSFNAILPTSPTYTYTSPAQQALYPGDKIVYTLGFDGYQNYNNGYPYNGGNCNYYDGTTNYPAPCSNSGYYSDNYYNQYPYYGNNPNNYSYNYSNNYSYNYQQYPYNQYQNYGNGVVTIVVDPNNYLYESSKANNTASTYLH